MERLKAIVRVAWLFFSLLGCIELEATESLEARVQLVPRRYAVIAAQISSKIESLPFREGDSFSSGQLLVGFDDAAQQAQFRRAKSELEAARHIAQGNKRLHELNSIGQIELELSQAAVETAAAELEYLNVMVDRCRIAAPYDGRVSEFFVQEQEFVQAGQPIMEIIASGLPEIEFLAPSNWLSWLSNGLGISVFIEETQKTYPAEIASIGARVDPVSQSIKIRATFREEALELISGMSGVIRISR